MKVNFCGFVLIFALICALGAVVDGFGLICVVGVVLSDGGCSGGWSNSMVILV